MNVHLPRHTPVRTTEIWIFLISLNIFIIKSGWLINFWHCFLLVSLSYCFLHLFYVERNGSEFEATDLGWVFWLRMYANPQFYPGVKSIFTWRHGGHIGVPKQWNGGHVGVPRQPYGNWTLFWWKYFRLFVVSIGAGYVSKYALYVALNNVVTRHLSTCTAERSFRSMKRLKTPLLRSIREDSLSCLEILHIHKREDVNWPLHRCWLRK